MNYSFCQKIIIIKNFINIFTIYMNYSFCQVHFYELVCTKHIYHQTKQSIIKYYFQHLRNMITALSNCMLFFSFAGLSTILFV